MARSNSRRSSGGSRPSDRRRAGGARARRASSSYGGATAADIARNGLHTRRPGSADWGAADSRTAILWPDAEEDAVIVAHEVSEEQQAAEAAQVAEAAVADDGGQGTPDGISATARAYEPAEPGSIGTGTDGGRSALFGAAYGSTISFDEDAKPASATGGRMHVRKEGARTGSAGVKVRCAAAASAEAAKPRLRGIPLEETDRLIAQDKRALRKKAGISAAILVVLAFLSLGIIGANNDWEAVRYSVHSPLEVVQMIVWHVQTLFTGYPYDFSAMVSDYPFFFAMADKAGVVGITLICAVLLSVSGMLYQNVFKNPIAGPGMLGVSSGVTLGMMLLVYIFGVDAMSKIPERYAYCYLLGAAVLLFVILAGRKLSGKGKPFDIVTMLLIGSLVGQLVGFVVNYYTLFVMDPDLYQIYLTLSQMLVVDTSAISWAVLAIACAASLIPVWLLRFRMNALAFDEQEVKLLGINMTALRAVALVCGAIMILAAQIHVGAVAMVSLIVPFLSRAWFGCEFRKQLLGNVCIGTILLLACRDIVDLIPFVGDGIGIGSAVSIMALPLFLLIMAKHLRGWD